MEHIFPIPISISIYYNIPRNTSIHESEAGFMSIILANSKLRAYEYLNQLAKYADWKEERMAQLWDYLLKHEDLYDEFVYYLSHHEVRDNLHFMGYGILDLYVWQLNFYNMMHDTGKNTDICNKEDLILQAFLMMGEFMENPDDYLKKLSTAPHQDRL